ncbi:hypothetical protein [Thalassobacillus hwangdonensis]|uniref:DUF3139 domain-containing protein n=1 Tax=Thalassobacillus hwangdonensis TaxID=546108 RepID=A0ABW3L441_9BACI
MHPSTVIVLILLFGISMCISLLALLFSDKWKRFIWGGAALLLLAGSGFYAVRPWIVSHQIANATDRLQLHLKERYPEEYWEISDTDEYRIKGEVTLHVIFESENRTVYEYQIQGGSVVQTDMWLVNSGDPVFSDGVEPEHKESRYE